MLLSPAPSAPINEFRFVDFNAKVTQTPQNDSSHRFAALGTEKSKLTTDRGGNHDL